MASFITYKGLRVLDTDDPAGAAGNAIQDNWKYLADRVYGASDAEIGYLSGVTSAIQTQLGTKLANVVEDTTPQLGGDLALNGHTLLLDDLYDFKTSLFAFPAHKDLIPRGSTTYELDCSDPTAVTAETDTTLAADTTYFNLTGSAARPQGIKITPTALVNSLPGFRWTLSPTKDLTNYGCRLWLYVHEGTDGADDSWHHNNGVQLHFRDVGGNTASTIVWYSIGAVDEGVIGPTNSDLIHPGWVKVACLIGNKTTAGFDQTQINRVTVTESRGATISGRPSVTVAGLTLYPPPSTAYWSMCVNPVLVSGDGLGPQNTFKRLAYLASRGIDCDVGINPWRVGQTDHLTLTQCAMIRRMGHHISCYPTGPEYKTWAEQSQAERVEYTRYNQAWLRDKGFSDGISEYFLQTPSNGGDDYDENTFTGKYVAVLNNGTPYPHRGQPLYGYNFGMNNSMTHIDTTAGWEYWTGYSSYNGIKAAKGWMHFFSHCLTAELTNFDANIATLLSETDAGTITHVSLTRAYTGDL